MARQEIAVDPVTALRLALANTWAMYFKAHSFHWNVRGPMFSQYHKLFGDLYDDLHDAVDDLAEHIRALNQMAPASLDEIVGPSSIQFTPPPSCKDMVAQILADNQTVIDSISQANAAAVAAKNDGLQNYLQGRVDAHQKWGWMLRSSIEEEMPEAQEEKTETPAEARMEAPAENAPAPRPMPAPQRKPVSGGFLRQY